MAGIRLFEFYDLSRKLNQHGSLLRLGLNLCQYGLAWNSNIFSD